ncbi:hypothetical protein B296_00048077, partial [Ensete ventricosum]
QLPLFFRIFPSELFFVSPPLFLRITSRFISPICFFVSLLAYRQSYNHDGSGGVRRVYLNQRASPAPTPPPPTAAPPCPPSFPSTQIPFPCPLPAAVTLPRRRPPPFSSRLPTQTSSSAPLNPAMACPIRGPSFAAMPSRAAASDDRCIAVSDQQTEVEAANALVPGGTTYVTYFITTSVRPGSVDAGPAEFSVRRRFRDVVKLADRLAEAYRGFFIPPRPDKNLVDSQIMQKHEFVENRRLALEKYLRRLAEHPVIGKSDELRVFLQAKGKLPLPRTTDVASRMMDGAVRLPKQLFGEWAAAQVAPQDIVQPVKGSRDLLSIFKELKQAVVNDWGGVKPSVVEEDKEFLERKEKMHDLERQLTPASQQVCENYGEIEVESGYFSDPLMNVVSVAVDMVLEIELGAKFV